MAIQTPTLLGTILKAIVCTPNGNFDADNYARDVIEPTRRIRAWAEQTADAPMEPARAREALAMLASILEAKRVGAAELEARLREVADMFGMQPPAREPSSGRSSRTGAPGA